MRVINSILCLVFLCFMGACSHTKVLADKSVQFKDNKNIRVKVSILEGFSTESDKLTPNDQFATVVYKGNLILTTPVVQDKNLTHWQNQFVIFDYNTDSVVTISQLDDDYAYHDLLSQYTGKLIPGERKFKSATSYLIFKVEETSEKVTTNANQIPINTNLATFYNTIKATKVMTDHKELEK